MPMNTSQRLYVARFVLCGVGLIVTGCKPDAAVRTGRVVDLGTKHGTSAGASTGSAPDPTRTGALTGTILFRGAPPPRIPIDMSMDPACAFSQNASEQVVVSDGHLANVYVFVKGVASSQAPAGQAPVVLDQQGCRFIPHVIALQQGGSVQFSNSDRTMHNVHMLTTVAGNPSVDVSQGPGAPPQVERFNTPAVMVPVRCNNHPWMNAYLNVADSPFFAVTGADGRFSLRGLPPGNYTLAAVQEKLGEQDVAVTVLPNSTGTVNITYGH